MPDIKDQFDRIITAEELTASQLRSLLEADVKAVKDVKMKLKGAPAADKQAVKTDKRLEKLAKLMEKYFTRTAVKVNQDMKKAVQLLSQLNKKKTVQKSDFVDFSRSLVSSIEKIKLENKITVTPTVKMPEVRPVINNTVSVPGMNKLLGVMSSGFEKLTQAVDRLEKAQAKGVVVTDMPFGYGNADTVRAVEKLTGTVEQLRREQRSAANKSAASSRRDAGGGGAAGGTRGTGPQPSPVDVPYRWGPQVGSDIKIDPIEVPYKFKLEGDAPVIPSKVEIETDKLDDVLKRMQGFTGDIQNQLQRFEQAAAKIDATVGNITGSMNSIETALSGMADRIIEAVGRIAPSAEARKAAELVIQADLVKLQSNAVEISGQTVVIQGRVEANIGSGAPPAPALDEIKAMFEDFGDDIQSISMHLADKLRDIASPGEGAAKKLVDLVYDTAQTNNLKLGEALERVYQRLERSDQAVNDIAGDAKSSIMFAIQRIFSERKGFEQVAASKVNIEALVSALRQEGRSGSRLGFDPKTFVESVFEKYAKSGNEKTLQAILSILSEDKRPTGDNATQLISALSSELGTLGSVITSLVSKFRDLEGVSDPRSGVAFGAAKGGRVPRFAKGGEVSGLVPGSGNKDSVPVSLMTGQYVVRKKAVEAAGGAEGLVGMAQGGNVNSMVMPGEYVFTRGEAGKIGLAKLNKLNKLDKVPHLAKGGNIEKSGMAMVHAGEAVISPGDTTELGKLAQAGLKKGSIYVHDEIAHTYLKEISSMTTTPTGPVPKNIEDALKPLFDAIPGGGGAAKGGGKAAASDVGEIGASIKGAVTAKIVKTGSSLTLDAESFKKLLEVAKTIDLSGAGDLEIDIKASLIAKVVQSGSKLTIDPASFAKVVEKANTVDITGQGDIAANFKAKFAATASPQSTIAVDSTALSASVKSNIPQPIEVGDIGNLNATFTASFKIAFVAGEKVNLTMGSVVNQIKDVAKARVTPEAVSKAVGAIDLGDIGQVEIRTPFRAKFITYLDFAGVAGMTYEVTDSTADQIRKFIRETLDKHQFKQIEAGVIERLEIKAKFSARVKATFDDSDEMTVDIGDDNLAKIKQFVNDRLRVQNFDLGMLSTPVTVKFGIEFVVAFDDREKGTSKFRQQKDLQSKMNEFVKKNIVAPPVDDVSFGDKTINAGATFRISFSEAASSVVKSDTFDADVEAFAKKKLTMPALGVLQAGNLNVSFSVAFKAAFDSKGSTVDLADNAKETIEQWLAKKINIGSIGPVTLAEKAVGFSVPFKGDFQKKNSTASLAENASESIKAYIASDLTLGTIPATEIAEKTVGFTVPFKAAFQKNKSNVTLKEGAMDDIKDFVSKGVALGSVPVVELSEKTVDFTVPFKATFQAQGSTTELAQGANDAIKEFVKTNISVGDLPTVALTDIPINFTTSFNGTFTANGSSVSVDRSQIEVINEYLADKVKIGKLDNVATIKSFDFAATFKGFFSEDGSNARSETHLDTLKTFIDANMVLPKITGVNISKNFDFSVNFQGSFKEKGSNVEIAPGVSAAVSAYLDKADINLGTLGVVNLAEKAIKFTVPFKAGFQIKDSEIDLADNAISDIRSYVNKNLNLTGLTPIAVSDKDFKFTVPFKAVFQQKDSNVTLADGTMAAIEKYLSDKTSLGSISDVSLGEKTFKFTVDLKGSFIQEGSSVNLDSNAVTDIQTYINGSTIEITGLTARSLELSFPFTATFSATFQEAGSQINVSAANVQEYLNNATITIGDLSVVNIENISVPFTATFNSTFQEEGSQVQVATGTGDAVKTYVGANVDLGTLPVANVAEKTINFTVPFKAGFQKKGSIVTLASSTNEDIKGFVAKETKLGTLPAVALEEKTINFTVPFKASFASNGSSVNVADGTNADINTYILGSNIDLGTLSDVNLGDKEVSFTANFKASFKSEGSQASLGDDVADKIKKAIKEKISLDDIGEIDLGKLEGELPVKFCADFELEFDCPPGQEPNINFNLDDVKKSIKDTIGDEINAEAIGDIVIGKLTEPIAVKFCADFEAEFDCPPDAFTVSLQEGTVDTIKESLKKNINIGEINLEDSTLDFTVKAKFNAKILKTSTVEMDRATLEDLAKKKLKFSGAAIDITDDVNFSFKANFKGKPVKGSSVEIDREAFIEFLNEKIGRGSFKIPGEKIDIPESSPIHFNFKANFKGKPVQGSSVEIGREEFTEYLGKKTLSVPGAAIDLTGGDNIEFNFKAAFTAHAIQEGSTVEPDLDSIKKLIRNKMRGINLMLNREAEEARKDAISEPIEGEDFIEPMFLKIFDEAKEQEIEFEAIPIRIKGIFNPYAKGDDITLDMARIKKYLRNKIADELKTLTFEDTISIKISGTAEVSAPPGGGGGGRAAERAATPFPEVMKVKEDGDCIRVCDQELRDRFGEFKENAESFMDKVGKAFGEECLKVCDEALHAAATTINEKLEQIVTAIESLGNKLGSDLKTTIDAENAIDVRVINDCLTICDRPGGGGGAMVHHASTSLATMEEDCLEVCDYGTHELLQRIGMVTVAIWKTLKDCCEGEAKRDKMKRLEDRSPVGDVKAPVTERVTREDVRSLKTPRIFSGSVEPLKKFSKGIEGLMDKLLGYNPMDKWFSGAIKEEAQFRRDLFEILYIQEGINKQNRSIQRQYEMHNKTLLGHESSWANISDVTGQDIQKNLTNYLKLLRAGIKEQDRAIRLAKIAGSLATATGISAEKTGETLEFWTNQLGLSTRQSAQLARGMKDVARLTGLTGDNLERAVKSSENLLKKLRDAGTLSADTARNFMTIRAQAEKLGVGSEVERLVEGLTGGTDFFENMNGQLRDFIAAAAGSVGDSGLIQEYLMGRGGERRNIQRTASAIRGLVERLAGVQIDQLDRLTGAARTRVDLILNSLSGGTVRIGNVARIVESLDTAGLSFAQRLANLQSQAANALATSGERALAMQQQTQLIMGENLRVQSRLDEIIQRTPEGANRLTNAINSLLTDMTRDAGSMGQLRENLRAMGIEATAGADILRQSLEGTYNNLVTQLEEVGRLDLLKVRREDIEAALTDQSGQRFRQLLEDLNESSEALATQQRTQTDPMTELTQELRVLNAALRGITGGALSNFMDKLGKGGFLIAALVAGLGSTILALQTFRFFLGSFASAFGLGGGGGAAAGGVAAGAAGAGAAAMLPGMGRPFAGMAARAGFITGILQGVGERLAAFGRSVRGITLFLFKEPIKLWSRGFQTIFATLGKGISQTATFLWTPIRTVGGWLGSLGMVLGRAVGVIGSMAFRLTKMLTYPIWKPLELLSRPFIFLARGLSAILVGAAVRFGEMLGSAFTTAMPYITGFFIRVGEFFAWMGRGVGGLFTTIGRNLAWVGRGIGGAVTGAIQAIGKSRAWQAMSGAFWTFAGKMQKFFQAMGSGIGTLMKANTELFSRIGFLTRFGRGAGAAAPTFAQGATLARGLGPLRAVGKIVGPVASRFGSLLRVLGPIAGAIATVQGAFEGITNPAKELGKTMSVVAGIFTGGTQIGSAGMEGATLEERQNAEAKGLGMAALQGSAVGALLGSVIPGIGTAIGSIVGALAGVVIELYKIVKFGGALKTNIMNMVASIMEGFEFVKEGAMDLFNSLKAPFEQIKNDLSAMFGGGGAGGAVAKFLEGFGKFVRFLGQVLGFALKIVGSGLAKVLEVAWMALKPFIEGIKRFVGGIMEAIQGISEGNMKKVFSGLGNAILGALEAIVIGALAYVAGIPALIVAAIGGIFTKIGTFISENFGLEGLGGLFQNLGGIIDGVKDALGGLFDILQGILRMDFSKIGEGFKKIGQGIGKIFVNLWQGIQNFGKTVIEFVVGIPQKIRSFFASIDWKAVGKNIADSIMEGINQFVTWVQNIPWGDIVDKIISFFVNTNWLEVGGYILAGIAGVLIGIPALFIQIVSAIGEGIFSAIGGIFSGIADRVREYFAPLGVFFDGLAGVFSGVAEIFGGIVDVVSALFQLDFSAALEGLGRIGEGILEALEGVWKTVVGFFGSIGGAILKGLGSIVEWIGDALGIDLSGFTESIVNFWNGLVDFVASIPRRIINFFKSIPEAFMNFIRAIPRGFQWVVAFLKDLWEGLIGAVVNMAAGVLQWLGDNLPDWLGGDKLREWAATMRRSVEGYGSRHRNALRQQIAREEAEARAQEAARAAEQARLEALERERTVANDIVNVLNSAIGQGIEVRSTFAATEQAIQGMVFAARDLVNVANRIRGRNETERTIRQSFVQPLATARAAFQQQYNFLQNYSAGGNRGDLFQLLSEATSENRDITGAQLMALARERNIITNTNADTVRALVNDYIGAQRRLAELTQAQTYALQNMISPLATARENVVDMIGQIRGQVASGAQDQMFIASLSSSLADELWEVQTLSGLTGEQLYNNLGDVFRDAVQGNTSELITSRHTNQLLGSGLTYEQRQVQLMEEQNRLIQEAEGARERGEVQRWTNLVSRIAELQEATRRNEQMRQSVQVLQSIARRLQADSVYEQFATQAQITQLANLRQAVAETARRVGETPEAYQARIQTAQMNLDRLLADLASQRLARGAVTRDGQFIEQLLSGTPAEMLDQLSDIIRRGFNEQQLLMTDDAQAMMRIFGRDQRMQAIQLRREELVAQMGTALRTRTGEDLRTELVNIGRQMASLLAVQNIQITPIQELSNAVVRGQEVTNQMLVSAFGTNQNPNAILGRLLPALEQLPGAIDQSLRQSVATDILGIQRTNTQTIDQWVSTITRFAQTRETTLRSNMLDLIRRVQAGDESARSQLSRVSMQLLGLEQARARAVFFAQFSATIDPLIGRFQAAIGPDGLTGMQEGIRDIITNQIRSANPEAFAQMSLDVFRRIAPNVVDRQLVTQYRTLATRTAAAQTEINRLRATLVDLAQNGVTTSEYDAYYTALRRLAVLTNSLTADTDAASEAEERLMNARQQMVLSRTGTPDQQAAANAALTQMLPEIGGFLYRALQPREGVGREEALRRTVVAISRSLQSELLRMNEAQSILQIRNRDDREAEIRNQRQLVMGQITGLETLIGRNQTALQTAMTSGNAAEVNRLQGVLTTNQRDLTIALRRLSSIEMASDISSITTIQRDLRGLGNLTGLFADIGPEGISSAATTIFMNNLDTSTLGADSLFAQVSRIQSREGREQFAERFTGPLQRQMNTLVQAFAASRSGGPAFTQEQYSRMLEIAEQLAQIELGMQQPIDPTQELRSQFELLRQQNDRIDRSTSSERNVLLESQIQLLQGILNTLDGNLEPASARLAVLTTLVRDMNPANVIQEIGRGQLTQLLPDIRRLEQESRTRTFANNDERVAFLNQGLDNIIQGFSNTLNTRITTLMQEQRQLQETLPTQIREAINRGDLVAAGNLTAQLQERPQQIEALLRQQAALLASTTNTGALFQFATRGGPGDAQAVTNFTTALNDASNGMRNVSRLIYAGGRYFGANAANQSNLLSNLEATRVTGELRPISPTLNNQSLRLFGPTFGAIPNNATDANIPGITAARTGRFGAVLANLDTEIQSLRAANRPADAFRLLQYRNQIEAMQTLFTREDFVRGDISASNQINQAGGLQQLATQMLGRGNLTTAELNLPVVQAIPPNPTAADAERIMGQQLNRLQLIMRADASARRDNGVGLPPSLVFTALRDATITYRALQQRLAPEDRNIQFQGANVSTAIGAALRNMDTGVFGVIGQAETGAAGVDALPSFPGLERILDSRSGYTPGSSVDMARLAQIPIYQRQSVLTSLRSNLDRATRAFIEDQSDINREMLSQAARNLSIFNRMMSGTPEFEPNWYVEAYRENEEARRAYLAEVERARQMQRLQQGSPNNPYSQGNYFNTPLPYFQPPRGFTPDLGPVRPDSGGMGFFTPNLFQRGILDGTQPGFNMLADSMDPMERNISMFTSAALRRGSIYTHDVGVQTKVEDLGKAVKDTPKKMLELAPRGNRLVAPPNYRPRGDFGNTKAGPVPELLGNPSMLPVQADKGLDVSTSIGGNRVSVRRFAAGEGTIYHVSPDGRVVRQVPSVLPGRSRYEPYIDDAYSKLKSSMNITAAFLKATPGIITQPGFLPTGGGTIPAATTTATPTTVGGGTAGNVTAPAAAAIIGAGFAGGTGGFGAGLTAGTVLTPVSPPPGLGARGTTTTTAASTRAIPRGLNLTGASLPPPSSPEIALTTLINRSSGARKNLYLQSYRARQIAMASGINWDERVGGSQLFPTYAANNRIEGYRQGGMFIPLKINGTMVDPASLTNAELENAVAAIQRRLGYGGGGGTLVPLSPFMDELNRRRGIPGGMGGMPQIIGNATTTGRPIVTRTTPTLPVAPTPPAPTAGASAGPQANSMLLRAVQQRMATGSPFNLGATRGMGRMFQNLPDNLVRMPGAGDFQVIVGPNGRVIGRRINNLTGAVMYAPLIRRGTGLAWGEPSANLNAAYNAATPGVLSLTNVDAVPGATGPRTTTTQTQIQGGGNTVFPDIPNLMSGLNLPAQPAPPAPAPLPGLAPPRVVTGGGGTGPGMGGAGGTGRTGGGTLLTQVIRGLLPPDLGGTAGPGQGILPPGIPGMLQQAQQRVQQRDIARTLMAGSQLPPGTKEEDVLDNLVTIGGVPVGYRQGGNLVPFTDLTSLTNEQLERLAGGALGIQNLAPGQARPEGATLVSNEFLDAVSSLLDSRRTTAPNLINPAFNRSSIDLIEPLTNLGNLATAAFGPAGPDSVIGQIASGQLTNLNPGQLSSLEPELSMLSASTDPVIAAEATRLLRIVTPRANPGMFPSGQQMPGIVNPTPLAPPGMMPGPNGFQNIQPGDLPAPTGGGVSLQRSLNNRTLENQRQTYMALTGMESDIATLTRDATTMGSIYTHDINLGESMDALLTAFEKVVAEPAVDKAKEVEVQPVLPNGLVDPEEDVRKRKAEEAASMAPIQTEYLGTIAENTEEEAKTSEEARKLLAQAVEALSAIKDLLTPTQRGGRKGNNRTRDLFEEPFFDSISETEYQYDPGNTAPFDIDSQYP